MSGLILLPLMLCGTALVLNIITGNLAGVLFSIAGLMIGSIPLLGRGRK